LTFPDFPESGKLEPSALDTRYEWITRAYVVLQLYWEVPECKSLSEDQVDHKNKLEELNQRSSLTWLEVEWQYLRQRWDKTRTTANKGAVGNVWQFLIYSTS